MDPSTGRERRWWNELRCGDAATSSTAAFALAALLCERERGEEAEAILRDFSKADSDPIAAAATIRLAQLIERQNGSEEAALAFEAAASRASATDSPDVLLDLAARWATMGEIRRADEAYRNIGQECANPGLRAVAGFRLGVMQREAGLLRSAIHSWELSLEEASALLRPHLLVSLAEALLDGDAVPLDRAEALLQEVIDSDHPDLAPRAALRLARLKRGQGEFIDAYRLVQLVVNSEHPVFGPQAERERDRLVDGGELDALLELSWPDPNQLELSEGYCCPASCEPLHIPIAARNLIIHTHMSAAHFDSTKIQMPDEAWHSDCDLSPVDCSLNCSPAPGARTFLFRAILGLLSNTDLKVVKDAIYRDHRRVVGDGPYGGSICRVVEPLRTPTVSRRWRGRNEDLEFLILLRAAAWLRVEARPPFRGVSLAQYRLIFDRTSARLSQLLDGVQVSATTQDGSPSFLPDFADAAERGSSWLRAELPRREHTSRHIPSAR